MICFHVDAKWTYPSNHLLSCEMQEIPPHQVGKLCNIRIIGNFIVSARAWLQPSTRMQKINIRAVKVLHRENWLQCHSNFLFVRRIYSNSRVFDASVCVCVCAQSIVHQLKMVESNKIIVLSICHKLNEPLFPPAAGCRQMKATLAYNGSEGGKARTWELRHLKFAKCKFCQRALAATSAETIRRIFDLRICISIIVIVCARAPSWQLDWILLMMLYNGTMFEPAPKTITTIPRGICWVFHHSNQCTY